MSKEKIDPHKFENIALEAQKQLEKRHKGELKLWEEEPMVKKFHAEEITEEAKLRRRQK